MSEALARVKADLGSDAVILHTRTISTGGVLGVGAKSQIEIVATRDAHVVPRSGPPSRATGNAAASASPPPTRPGEQAPGGRYGATGVLQAARAQVDAATLRFEPTTPRVTLAPTPAASDATIRAEVNEIRGMVEQILRETRAGQAPRLPAELIDYYTGLIGQDVSAELARQVLERVSIKLNQNRDKKGTGGLPGEEVIRGELRACVSEMLPPMATLKLTAGAKPTIVALVGPTGVGKTTTVAKLAAVMKLRERRRVGLITMDTYRIGAVEQLRTYAQILDVPLISVMTPMEMKTAVARMSDRDLILIDTAGRSQRDDEKIVDLKKMLDAAEPDQVHLVLSTTGREETMRQAVERFRPVGVEHLVFTKLDEAVGLGVMLNVLHNVKLKLSYLTSGQAVPDDIEPGSAARVAELILAGLPRMNAKAPAPAVAKAPVVQPGRAVR